MPPVEVLVTTCSARRLPNAIVLARSFLAQHPGASATVVVSDLVGPAPELADPGLVVVAGSGLDVDGFEVLAAAHDADALADALAPWALRAAPRPALWLAGEGVVLAPIELDAGEAALVLRADADAGTAVVDPRFAVVSPEADAVLESWQGDVAALAERAPLAVLLARFEAVTLTRSVAWGVDAGNAGVRGVRDDGERLVLPDGSAVAWVRVGPGLVPDALLRVRAERDAAARELPAVGSGFDVMADGTMLDARLRDLFARGLREGALTTAPFSPAGCAVFFAWLRDPDPAPDGGGLGRYLLDVWRSRADLRTAYADLRDAGVRDGLVGWLAMNWDAGFPVSLRPGFAAPSRAEASGDPIGVNVAGYFQSEVGVGEVARRVIAALDRAHVPLLPVQGATAPSSRRGEQQLSTSLAGAPFDVNLVCVNADGLPRFADEAGSAFFDGRYTIGLWWWELPEFPSRFAGAFEHVDEVWVGSRYVFDAIAPVSPVPVMHIPVAVERPRVTPMSRAELGLPEGFLVLFLFDFHSVMERKNPLGLVEAFERAFGGDDGASLVIKCVNAAHHPEAAQELRLAAFARPRVQLVEDYVSAEVRDAMIASCDCYASLHRSEGFGLTLAEAMALGRPTVATNWSGNLDFMTDDTSWLIGCELVPVGEGHPPYDPKSLWAEPDLDLAAAALREIRADPEAAATRAAAGVAAIAELRNPAVAGDAMRGRLDALRSQIAGAAEKAAARRRANLLASVETARGRVARTPDEFQRPGGPLLRGARRVLARALRPAVTNQQAADRYLLDALEDGVTRLSAQFEAGRAAQAAMTASVLAAQRRLDAQGAAATPTGDHRRPTDAEPSEAGR